MIAGKTIAHEASGDAALTYTNMQDYFIYISTTVSLKV